MSKNRVSGNQQMDDLLSGDESFIYSLASMALPGPPAALGSTREIPPETVQFCGSKNENACSLGSFVLKNCTEMLPGEESSPPVEFSFNSPQDEHMIITQINIPEKYLNVVISVFSLSVNFQHLSVLQ